MRISRHLAVSVSIAAVFWYMTRSFSASLVSFLSGTLIDIDHALEYVIHFGTRGISFRNICVACEQTPKQDGPHAFRKLYLVLHMFELAFLLWGMYIFIGNIHILAAAVGYSAHILMDSLGNPIPVSAYIFTRRAAKGFVSSRLL